MGQVGHNSSRAATVERTRRPNSQTNTYPLRRTQSAFTETTAQMKRGQRYSDEERQPVNSTPPLERGLSPTRQERARRAME
ncbi:hypothetical protein Bca4012_071834 [Brassica carinata]|uniref:Uncharacterized protein n=1 Tax=Brassica carinata TaxID=52824 RepID=A0A8X7QG28_BRACI|nr:hypothetical protein Bca52824_064082 [Brassica carinata]